jgi:membrane protein DedA with SNARE-associated domain
LSFPLVVLTAILGNVAGDNAGYWLTRKYGVKVLHFLGMRKVVTSEKYLKVHESVNSHPILLFRKAGERRERLKK